MLTFSFPGRIGEGNDLRTSRCRADDGEGPRAARGWAELAGLITLMAFSDSSRIASAIEPIAGGSASARSLLAAKGIERRHLEPTSCHSWPGCRQPREAADGAALLRCTSAVRGSALSLAAAPLG